MCVVDWGCYKRWCDCPYVFSRWMLEQTLELVDDDLKVELRQALASAPLAKPEDHKGGAATDMLTLSMSRAQVHAVVRCVEAAARRGTTTSATRGRGLGGFAEAWREYLAYLSSDR